METLAGRTRRMGSVRKLGPVVFVTVKLHQLQRWRFVRTSHGDESAAAVYPGARLVQDRHKVLPGGREVVFGEV